MPLAKSLRITTYLLRESNALNFYKQAKVFAGVTAHQEYREATLN